jgi:uncharacterized protein YeaO (DUF488 family)
LLSETYKRNIKNIKSTDLDPQVKFIDVTRTSNSSLSPSWDLIGAVKKGKITWEEYSDKFRAELVKRKVESELIEIAKQAINHNVYLVCFEKGKECHRFILLDMIKQLAEREGIPVVVKTQDEIKQGL